MVVYHGRICRNSPKKTNPSFPIARLLFFSRQFATCSLRSFQHSLNSFRLKERLITCTVTLTVNNTRRSGNWKPSFLKKKHISQLGSPSFCIFLGFQELYITQNCQGASATAACHCGACSGRHRGAGRCLTFAAKRVLLEEDIWHLPNTQIQMCTYIYMIYMYL